MPLDAPPPLSVSADMIGVGRALRVVSVEVRNLHGLEWLYVEFWVVDVLEDERRWCDPEAVILIVRRLYPLQDVIYVEGDLELLWEKSDGADLRIMPAHLVEVGLGPEPLLEDVFLRRWFHAGRSV